jgi:hypothetical protein
MACFGLRRIELDRVRVAVAGAIGVPVQADPASQAQSWLNGTGDLVFIGQRGLVPLAVRLGVLAHADMSRLTELGRNRGRGSVRRTWGTEMAGLAGDIAQHAGAAEALAAFQRDILLPLELELLAGHVTFDSSGDLIAYVRDRLSADRALADDVY